MNYFNINSQESPTNKDLEIIFTPDRNIKNYNYFVYKDEELIDTDEINKPIEKKIVLKETGIYKIEIETFDYYNNKNNISSGIYNIDKDKPVLYVGESILNIKLGSSVDVMGGVSAKDNIDGNITNKVITNFDELDLTTAGVKKLVYTISDEAGNISNKEVTINVQQFNLNSLYLFQSAITLCLLIIIVLLFKYRKSIELEKRISKYSFDSIKDNSVSLFDGLTNSYRKIVRKISKYVSKSVFLTKLAKKYDKYIAVNPFSDGIDLVSSKIFTSVVFLIIAILSKTLKYEIISMYEVCFPMIVGFFVPDIIYITKYKLYKSKLENDLLQAIIIMNNAFKSGRSITQAIHLVTTELDGPISNEFKKMEMELSFGLGIDVVFKRFASRVNLEEVTYLTASLTILNNTGGNIIKVFSSIEKSLFNKKKLKLELDSLTGSSKIIVKVLFAVPFLFVIFVATLNPSYFMPFFTTTIGLILLGIMVIYYLIYIFFVRKIMKVRM